MAAALRRFERFLKKRPELTAPALPVAHRPVAHRLIALRVRQQRVKLGLTQAEAAARSGLPIRTYRRFESSGHGNVDTLYAVAMAFDRVQAVESIFGVWAEKQAGDVKPPARPLSSQT